MTTTKKQQNQMKGAENSAAREEARIDRIIKSYRASFMSNAKWRKALILLADSFYSITCYRWKFVDSEKLYETSVVNPDKLAETYIKEGDGQPFSYREVEWLEVVTAHVTEITGELLKKGQFALDENSNGFRIIAYAA